MPVKLIDVGNAFPDHFSWPEIVNRRLGFVVKQDAAICIRYDDPFIKGIEHR